jgi:hypothetical protein
VKINGKEGQDPASHMAQARIPVNIEGGTAKGMWEYRLIDTDELPESDPRFFFTAHSAWCQYKESGNMTVELKRPELTSPEWKDKDGNSTDKGLVGEPLKLSVSCNADTQEGAGVVFRVYSDGADPKRDTPTEEISATNQGGKVEAEWTYHYRHDPDNPLTEKPKFFFTANGQRCKEAKSENVETGQSLYVEFVNKFGKPLEETIEYELKHPSGESIKGKASEAIEKDNLIPGEWEIILTNNEDAHE